jgi:predicted dehydrogenase
MTNVGIGLVGAGRIAQAAHLPALGKADGAELVALCDPSEVLSREVARRYDVPGYRSLDELLEDDAVEAVILAVPDRLHLSLGRQALEAGRHVLVEKPLAGTLAEAEELEAIAASSGRRLQLAAMKRYDPGVQVAADAVRTRIGTVLTASLWYRVHSALRAPIESTYAVAPVIDERVRAKEVAFKADRPGYLLLTHGAHVFDELRYLLGDPVAITARRTRAAEDLSWHALAELADGGLAHVEISAAVHSEWSEGADIYGDRGHVKLRTHVPFALRASDVEVFEEATATASRPVFGDSDPYERQLEAFVRAISGGTPTSPDATDGVAALRIIAAVAESVAHDGERMPL